MSAKLTLAGPEALGRLYPMIAACHDEAGVALDEGARQAAIAPLLEGSPLGAIYLIGPPASPIGYVALSFGWSIAAGGMEGTVQEIWLRPAVRGRGVGTEVLSSLLPALSDAGLKAIQVRTPEPAPRKLYTRLRFTPGPRPHLLTRAL